MCWVVVSCPKIFFVKKKLCRVIIVYRPKKVFGPKIWAWAEWVAGGLSLAKNYLKLL